MDYAYGNVHVYFFILRWLLAVRCKNGSKIIHNDGCIKILKNTILPECAEKLQSHIVFVNSVCRLCRPSQTIKRYDILIGCYIIIKYICNKDIYTSIGMVKLLHTDITLHLDMCGKIRKSLPVR